MSAQPVSFVVLHPQAIAAEALATALGRYPGLMPARTATRASEIPRTQRYDGAVIDRACRAPMTSPSTSRQRVAGSFGSATDLRPE